MKRVVLIEFGITVRTLYDSIAKRYFSRSIRDILNGAFDVLRVRR